ncbi:MAG: 3-deoxy-D-manno-octulosonic acid kinase [Candidatus Marinimicrobia bacterium]|nr:3-deoxy-D-manno-octulosonic acid kinase [Candidatus Neomarinimicrobiota bacterium]
MVYKPLDGLNLTNDQIAKLSARDWVLEHAAYIYKDHTNLVAKLDYPIENAPNKYVIKLFGWRNTLSKILSPVMRSRAKKSWDTAHFLLSNDIPTPAPLAVYTSRRYGFVRKNFYLCECINDFNSARAVLRRLDTPEPEKAKLVKIIAKIVRRMHKANFVHNDLTLANFLVEKIQPDRVYLVDLNRGVHYCYLRNYRRIMDVAKMDLCSCDFTESHSGCYRDQFLRQYRDDYERDRRLLRMALQRKGWKKRWKNRIRK